MSIYFNFEVGPKGRMFRRAVDQDKMDIERFRKKEETETLFYNNDIGRLIELSTLAIVMIDESHEVTGFLALCDHPPLPAIDPSAWDLWMRNECRMFYLPRNTLFIHFTCCMDSVSSYFLKEALISVFMNDLYLHHVILVVPPSCNIGCLKIYDSFRKRSIVMKHCVKSEELNVCYSACSLFVANRNDYCPKMRIRLAVEQDNDVVVDILDKQCKRLKELYGSFYISEILSQDPGSGRSIIVAEDPVKLPEKQSLIGVMCLSSVVNYEKLQQDYELAPYHGLVLPGDKEKKKLDETNSNQLLQMFGEPIMCGKWTPFENLDRKTFGGTQRKKKDTKIQKLSKSKVVFQKDDNLRSHAEEDSAQNISVEEEKINSPPLLTADVSLMFLANESENFDYEIVNIDTNLLNVSFDSVASVDLPCKDGKIKRSSVGCRRTRKTKNRNVKSTVNEETGTLYQGKPNAFIIELFALRDQIDERRAYDLLEAAFDCMDQYEYCIIRIPCDQQTFPLLQHFTVVPGKNHKCEYALYIAHRNSVLGKLRVREAEVTDIPQIAKFLHNLDGKDTIRTIERTIHGYNQKQHAYIFLCGFTIIGVGIIDAPKNVDMIREQFDVDAYQHMRYHVSGNGVHQGTSMIKTVLVYPAFEPHFGFFARDMMRLAGCNTLMWLTAYKNKLVVDKANGILSAMTPLTYRITGLKEYCDSSKNSLPFSAWILSKKMTSIGKLNVDCRIVVVGASRTAMAFLHHLIFGESAAYLNFTNVTVISKHGRPYPRFSHPAAELMFPKYRSTCDRFLKSTPFTYYVNFVQGTVVEINKLNKYIVIKNGHKVYYDLLFLMIGKQYQHPDYLKDLDEKLESMRKGEIPRYIRMDDPRSISSQKPPRIDFDTPENVFMVSNVYEANRSINYVTNCTRSLHDNKVVIYGFNIDAYCCVTAMLKLGIKAANIYFIEPFPPKDLTKPRVSFFCNKKVDKTVASYMESLHVNVYRGYYFLKWNVDECNTVKSVEFCSTFHIVELECNAFFYYGKRNLEANAFIAINKCGIAYDGGILIDHEFRTKVPFIYAAGPATRYLHHYQDSNKIHKFYDCHDIGKTLGKQIQNQLDPFFHEKNKVIPVQDASTPSEISPASSSTASVLSPTCKSSLFKKMSSCHSQQCSTLNTIPRLLSPKYWYCVLPGKLQYLEVRRPGPMYPHYYVQSLDKNGTVIETFESGYFKLHLNKDLVVDGITCLTPSSDSIEHLWMLYGQSSVTLNNVYLRHRSSELTDLFAFFRMPWSFFLYHERTKDLIEFARNLMLKDVLNRKKTLQEIFEDMTESKDNVSKKGDCNFQLNIEAITDYIIEWLSDFDQILPMYFTPNNLVEFTHHTPSRVIFKRRKRSINKLLSFID